MASSKSILILGGGVVGLCTAFYAAQKGHRVTVVERNPRDRDGCSFGNAGLIVPSHFIPLAAPGMVGMGLRMMWNPESPFYFKPRFDRDLWQWAWKFWRASTPQHLQQAAPLLRDLHLASRKCFEDLSALPGCDFGLKQNGLLLLCKTRAALDEEARIAERARSLGLPAEVLEARQTTELDPGIRTSIQGAVFYPQDGHLSPGRFMMSLQAELEKLGVQFAWQTEVVDWRATNRKLQGIVTTNGDFSADEYVICGGVWAAAMSRNLGLRIPMQAGKGYSLTLPQPRQLPTIPAILVEARLAVTPMGNTLRFGGTMELSGISEHITASRIRGIIKSAIPYFPDFTPEDFHPVRPWAGLRPCSPDGLPYLGRFGRYENLSIAAGHAMMGISLGPISGRLMAQILSDETPEHDLQLLNPDRFA